MIPVMLLKRVIKIFPAHEILALTGRESPDTQVFEVDGQSYWVHMRSLRFECFRRRQRCVVCGLRGTKMVLEFGSPVAGSPHFNLYGEEDGELVLMTKDHITPVSHGGKNRLTNLQTMCTRCNGIKAADKDLTFEQILKRRRRRQRKQAKRTRSSMDSEHRTSFLLP